MRLFLARDPYLNSVSESISSILVWNGQRAVQCFFTISGFLITTTSLRRWRHLHEIDVPAFYKLRVARIFPLLTVVLTLLAALHFARWPNFIISDETGGILAALGAAVTFRINILEATRGYLPPSWDVMWSLSVEEMFYLWFPLVSRVFGRRNILIMPSISIFVLLGPIARTYFAGVNEVWREYSYLGGADAIAIGIATALVRSRVHLSTRAGRFLGTLGLGLLVFCFAGHFSAFHRFLDDFGVGMSVVAVGTSLTIIWSTRTRWRPSGLWRLVGRVGKLSYEIYLTHIFVVLMAFQVYGVFSRWGAAIPIYFAAVMVGSVLLGLITSLCWTEPANSRWRRLMGVGVTAGTRA